MISVYIKDKEIFIAQGASSGGKLKVKTQYHADNLEDINGAAIELLGKLDLKKESLRFVIDNAAATTVTKPMHCVPERKIQKAVKNNSARKAKTVGNQLDVILNCVDKYENKQIETTAHITAIPSSLAYEAQQIVAAVGVPLDNIVVGNTAEAKVVAAINNVPFNNIITVSYKKSFATLSAYSDGKQTYSYNVAFTEKDDSLTFERLSELAHNAIRESKERDGVIIEAVYVLGDIKDKYRLLERLADDVGLDCLEFVAPKSFKGVSSEELNAFAPAFGGLLD